MSLLIIYFYFSNYHFELYAQSYKLYFEFHLFSFKKRNYLHVSHFPKVFLFYNSIIRISQVYSLFRRLMLAASAQSP